jgi:hypothetical protein
MARLNDMTKSVIVTMLAQFCSTAEIIAHLSAEYDVRVDRFQIRTYDPTKPSFVAGAKWRSLFEDVRSNYLHQLDAIPISHKGYRLNQLQRNFDRASRAGNLVLANSILKQAAQEVGGTLTNERKLAMSAGPERLSAEQRRVALAELIDRSLGHLSTKNAVKDSAD